MKTPRTTVARMISDKTLKGSDSKVLATEVAAYLLSERRVNELDSVMRDVQADWAEAGIIEVVASSAHDLTTETRSDITKQVQALYPSASQIIVTHNQDPEVIGGVRLNLPNQQLDLSVEAKLNKFKQLTTAGKD